MIDYFSLAVSHGLLAFAFWRLMLRADLDSDEGEAEPERPARKRPGA